MDDTILDITVQSKIGKAEFPLDGGNIRQSIGFLRNDFLFCNGKFDGTAGGFLDTIKKLPEKSGSRVLYGKNKKKP